MAIAANKWLLDATILVDLMRGSEPARNWIDSLPEGACTISVITAAELLAGCRNRTEQRTVERELDHYEIAQALSILDLPLPPSPVEGEEWIEHTGTGLDSAFELQWR